MLNDVCCYGGDGEELESEVFDRGFGFTVDEDDMVCLDLTVDFRKRFLDW